MGADINIGSIHGESVPIPGVTLYVATDFAVHGFRADSRVNWELPELRLTPYSLDSSTLN